MNKKLYFGIAVLIIIVIAVGGFIYWQWSEVPQPKEEIAQDEKQLEQSDKPPVAGPGFKMVRHGDHWHEVPIDAPDVWQEETPEPTEPKVQWTAPEGTVTKPDFPKVDPKADPVKVAYKRLEYIKNNPYAWGGVHSPRATELIAQLMPPPVLIDHADGDRVYALIEELIAQGDPRAAEVLITNICEGSVAGREMFDGLVAIGPPAVQFILPYLHEDNLWAGTAAKILARIAVKYRDDLGGIVEHIIIPNITTIAADEHFERFSSGSVIDAQAALAQLQ